MSYELWAMSNWMLKVENSSFNIAHGSKPVAHSKKENHEKDITSHISVNIVDVDICTGKGISFKRDIRRNDIA